MEVNEDDGTFTNISLADDTGMTQFYVTCVLHGEMAISRLGRQAYTGNM